MCHGVHVRVRGQLLVCGLAFYLIGDRVLDSLLAGPQASRDSSVSTFSCHVGAQHCRYILCPAYVGPGNPKSSPHTCGVASALPIETTPSGL